MTKHPFDTVRSLLEIRYRMAEQDGDPGEALGVLRQMAKHQPDDPALAELVRLKSAELADSPAVVLIERVRSGGRCVRPPEGVVYIEEPDGRLSPANGEDIRSAEQRFPGFLKNWRLQEDDS